MADRADSASTRLRTQSECCESVDDEVICVTVGAALPNMADTIDGIPGGRGISARSNLQPDVIGGSAAGGVAGGCWHIRGVAIHSADFGVAIQPGIVWTGPTDPIIRVIVDSVDHSEGDMAFDCFSPVPAVLSLVMELFPYGGQSGERMGDGCPQRPNRPDEASASRETAQPHPCNGTEGGPDVSL